MTHPPHDCDDCGRLHMRWSEQERARNEAEEERNEHGDIAEVRLTRLHSMTPEGVPLYVEVEDPEWGKPVWPTDPGQDEPDPF